MKKLNVAVLGCLLCLVISCGTTTNEEANTMEETSSPNMTEQPASNLQTQIAKNKSIHIFDMPDGVTEAEWSAAIKELNDVVAEIGYPNAGYAFYKVENDSVKNNRYYFEGIWPAGDAYQKIHEHPAYLEAEKKFMSMYSKIKAVQMYRRLVLVE